MWKRDKYIQRCYQNKNEQKRQICFVLPRYDKAVVHNHKEIYPCTIVEKSKNYKNMAIGKNNEDWDAFLSNKKFANCESFGIIL